MKSKVVSQTFKDKPGVFSQCKDARRDVVGFHINVFIFITRLAKITFFILRLSLSLPFKNGV